MRSIFTPTRRTKNPNGLRLKRKRALEIAYLTQTISREGPFDKVRSMLSALVDTWQSAQRFRQTYAELDGLSTRELSDLGLSRSMITRVAYEAAYGPKA
jgi:uncharacterized protein YjiS (DUF1127 family)